MIAIQKRARALCVDQRGATAIEYGMIVALIAVACIGAFQAVGGGAGGKWNDIESKVSAALA